SAPAMARKAAPRVGLFRSHLWDTVDRYAEATLERAAAAAATAGAEVVEVAAPEGFETITVHRATISAFERARGMSGEWLHDRDRLGARTYEICERGYRITAEDYLAARQAV